LPAVVDALLEPADESAASIRTDRATLLEDGRDAALELRRLVHGDLRGMFDDPTTPGLDLSGPLVVLDLSALYNSAALGVLTACATAWLQATLAHRARPPGDPTGEDRRSLPVVTLGEGRPALAEAGAAARTGSRYLMVVDAAWAIFAISALRKPVSRNPTRGRRENGFSDWCRSRGGEDDRSLFPDLAAHLLMRSSGQSVTAIAAGW
jgi:hypothetical protein